RVNTSYILLPYYHNTSSPSFYTPVSHRDLLSFPTRRSSDLTSGLGHVWHLCSGHDPAESRIWCRMERCRRRHSLDFVDSDGRQIDRKSTRLNSSHGSISYAVFCLIKKMKTKGSNYTRRNQSS